MCHNSPSQTELSAAGGLDQRLRAIGGRFSNGILSWRGYCDAVARELLDHFGCSHVTWWRASTDAKGASFIATHRYRWDRPCASAASDDEPLVWRVPVEYLELLRSQGIVSCGDVHASPAAVQAVAPARAAFDVQAFMDARCSINGRLLGALSCEQTSGTRLWTHVQQQELLRAAQQLSVQIARRFRMHAVSARRSSADEGA